MLSFVNAKINIGLQIVNRREDGYHDLQTVFYPVGKYAGQPADPVAFCDILELYPHNEGVKASVKRDVADLLPRFRTGGRAVDCPIEKNLIYKAAEIICGETGADLSDMELFLEKHLPDGAGMGGGSADGAFALKMFAAKCIQLGIPQEKMSSELLLEMALRMGADCPFFIINRPCYASGVGELLEEIPLDLSGRWLLAIKPSIYISTKEAFSGVTPRKATFDLRNLPEIPLSEWRLMVSNDFEDSIFPLYPEIKKIKESLYDCNALYSSMTGSGSSVYGIFDSREAASEAENHFKGKSTIEGCYLLKL